MSAQEIAIWIISRNGSWDNRTCQIGKVIKYQLAWWFTWWWCDFFRVIGLLHHLPGCRYSWGAAEVVTFVWFIKIGWLLYPRLWVGAGVIKERSWVFSYFDLGFVKFCVIIGMQVIDVGLCSRSSTLRIFSWSGLSSGVFRQKESRNSGIFFGDWKVGEMKFQLLNAFYCKHFRYFDKIIDILIILHEISFFRKEPTLFSVEWRSGYASEAKHV